MLSLIFTLLPFQTKLRKKIRIKIKNRKKFDYSILMNIYYEKKILYVIYTKSSTTSKEIFKKNIEKNYDHYLGSEI